jgi:transposase
MTIDWQSIRQELTTDNDGRPIEYSYTGNPAVDPVIIFKLLLLQRWHPASDRKVVDRAATDIAYRFFLHLPIPVSIPDYSNLSKFRAKWGKKKIQALFKNIFRQVQGYGYAQVSEGLVGDITHSLAHIQKPTARRLILTCFEKLLQDTRILATNYPQYFDTTALLEICSAVQLWTDEYKAKVRSQEYQKEERFVILVQKILEVREQLRQSFPNEIPHDIVVTKEAQSFLTRKATLDQIINENVLISSAVPQQSDFADQQDEKKRPPPKSAEGRTLEDLIDTSGQKNVSKDGPREGLPLSDVLMPGSLLLGALTPQAQVLDVLVSQVPTIKQKKGERKIISLVDPAIRVGCKSTDNYFVGTKVSLTMTTDRFYSSVNTHAGNVHDGQQAIGMLRQAMDISGQTPAHFSLDLGFASIANRLDLHTLGVQPGIEFKPRTSSQRNGFFTDKDFQFDTVNLEVTCPSGVKTMVHSTDENAGVYTFKFAEASCTQCFKRPQCTASVAGRTVRFSAHQEVIIQDKRFLDTPEYDASRKLRWGLEAGFGTAKTAHGLKYTPYHGQDKAYVHQALTFVVMNLKRLLKLLYFPSLRLPKLLRASAASV